jgi:hypothetical protein
MATKVQELPRLIFVTCSLAEALLLFCGHARAATLAAWSESIGQRGFEARIVTDEPSCPPLIADGRPRVMIERSTPSGDFPIRVCVAPIPAGARHLHVGSWPLPAPVAHPRHIVAFGDTGCRVKGEVVQDCNDENAWPFREVAAHAAKEKPDLMIHLGDYVYRETRCRAGDDRCAGSPWGDNWSTWNSDFFTPAAPLLRRTAWVMARGNHEDCRRNGTGWTTLIGHDPQTEPCAAHEGPLLADLGGVKLAVLDDNDAADLPKDLDPAVVNLLKQDIAAALGAGADWIVTHHPFRGISKIDKRGPANAREGANSTLLAALGDTDEARLTLMLSGHIHDFQILNFAGAPAPQLVVGEGGAALDTGVPPRLTGLTTGGQTVADGLSLGGFGYVVMDRVGTGRNWNIIVHSPHGDVLRRCKLEDRKLSCAPGEGGGPAGDG